MPDSSGQMNEWNKADVAANTCIDITTTTMDDSDHEVYSS